MVIQGLGGRNKVDAPTATWEAAQSFLDRATEAGAPVYSMLIARPFDRPVVIDETNFHYLAVPSWDRMLKLPHDERVGARCAIPRRAPSCATRSSTTTAIPAQGTTVPPPLWNAVFVDEVAQARAREVPGRARSPTIADERGVAPADAMLDLALAEDLATEFRWRTESPEWAAAVGEAQLDARMMIGVSDGGAHLARDDGADWSSYFLRSWVLDRQRVDARGGHPPDHAGARGAASASPTGACSRPGAPADLMVFDPETIGPWKKEFVHDLPGGVGRFKAWGQGVHATVVNGVPIVLRRRAHRPPARPGRAARDGRAVSGERTPHRSDAVGVRRRRPHDRAAARVGRAAPGRSSGRTRHGCCRRPTTTASRAATASGFRIEGRSEAMGAPGPDAAPVRRRRSRSAAAPSRARGSTTWPSTASHAAALYPTFGLMIQGVTEREPALALCRALNDWVAEYCAHDPEHLIGVATLPMTERRGRARRSAPLRRGARLPRRVAPARALRPAPPPPGRRVRAAVVVPRRRRRAVRASTRA